MGLALLGLYLHFHSAVIMSEEHCILFLYLLLLFRGENLSSVCPLGRPVVLTKSIFLALASLLVFFKQLHIGIMIVGYEIDFESHPICKLGNTLY